MTRTKTADSVLVTQPQGVRRRLADLLADSVSVKDFGAVGDGTTDDTAAIQAAVSASYHRTLLFPNGVYLVSDSISIADQIHIRGEGGFFDDLYGTVSVSGTVIKLATGSFNTETRGMFEIEYVGEKTDQRMHVVFENIGLYGNRSGNQAPLSTHSRNAYGVGFLCMGARFVTVRNCFAIYFAEDGFKAVSGGTYNVSSNNLWITNSSFLANGDDGVEIFGGDSFLSGVNCGYNGGDGFAIQGCVGTALRSWDNMGYGMRIHNVDTVISGSLFYDNRRSGILVTGDLDGIVISGCGFQDNGRNTELTDLNRCGIQITGASSVSIAGICTGNKGQTGENGQRYGIAVNNAGAKVSYSGVVSRTIPDGVAKIYDVSTVSGSLMNRLKIGDASGAAIVSQVLTGSATVVIGEVASGATATETITVVGVVVGDICTAAINTLPSGQWSVSANCVVADEVEVTFVNHSGSPLTIPSGLLRVLITKVL